MPKMHGYELIAKVRNKPELQDLPIIVLTSRAGEKHYQKAIALGANDYLVKPFDDRKLLESVQKLLRSPVTLSR
jgi:chemosensory pili system protein ChpA (sensor histidine kinase/response regulator)